MSSTYQAPPFSPYDPSVPDLEPQTPELEHVLEHAMRAVAQRVHVCAPAKVHAVQGEQKVDVQLLPQVLYETDTAPGDLPIVLGVPVSMPMGANWSIKLPVAVGDLGWCVFADRSIDPYLAGDGSQTYSPDDSRLHDLGDAIFIPGLATYSGQTQDGTADMVLTNGQTQVRLTSDGKVVLKNQQAELLALLDQLCAQLSALASDLSGALVQVTSPGTPASFTPSSITQFTQVQTQVQQIQQTLDTLKA